MYKYETFTFAISEKCDFLNTEASTPPGAIIKVFTQSANVDFSFGTPGLRGFKVILYIHYI